MSLVWLIVVVWLALSLAVGLVLTVAGLRRKRR
jgi:hypothetical protein